jgi:hypothetical protein
LIHGYVGQIKQKLKEINTWKHCLLKTTKNQHLNYGSI